MVLVKHSSWAQRRMSPIDRFMSQVMPEPNSGCWLWMAACSGRDKNWYGTVTAGGKRYSAHHFSYLNFKGPIPEGLIVRHKCDVSICVNPDHLETGTYAENSQDREKRNRIKRKCGTESTSSKITEEDVIKIRNLAAVGVTDRELSEQFSLSVGAVHGIKMGLRWKHVKHLVDLWKNKK